MKVVVGFCGDDLSGSSCEITLLLKLVVSAKIDLLKRHIDGRLRSGLVAVLLHAVELNLHGGGSVVLGELLRHGELVLSCEWLWQELTCGFGIDGSCAVAENIVPFKRNLGEVETELVEPAFFLLLIFLFLLDLGHVNLRSVFFLWFT